MLKEITIPTFQQIATMSSDRCRQERMRLRNEISFARGNSLWGGPSAESDIATFKDAIDMIERRLQELASLSDENREHREPVECCISHQEPAWWEDTANHGM